MISWLKRNAPVIAGIAVSGGLLFLAVRNVDLGHAAKAVAGVNLAWLPPLAAVVLCDLLIRSLRWKLLLREAAPHAGVWHLIRLETIGLAINNVVFLRLGELARGVLAGRELSIPALSSLASIFIERLLDMAALCCLFAAAAYVQPGIARGELIAMALGIAGGIVVFLALLTSAERVPLESVLLRWPKLHGAVSQAMLGARALRAPAVVAQVAALSFSLWLMDACLYWFGAKAMSLVPEITYGRSIFVLSSAAASAILPAVPGAFGVFEQVVKVLLEGFGVDGSTALGYAAFIHLVNYAIITTLGIVFLYRAGLSLGRLKDLGSEPAS